MLITLIFILAACATGPGGPANEAIELASPTLDENDPTSTATRLATPVPSPSPTAVPPALQATEEPAVPAPSASAPAEASPLPSPTSEPDPPQVISGQTPEGAFFLGAADAPVTIIDYSDFL